jgi:arsenite-transporting ATPase
VLLISTDPAHSLSDVLQMKLGGKPRRVPLERGGKLMAWELNAASLFSKFLDDYKQDILEVIDRGSLFSKEEIAPLLDTTLPGMSEISALLAIHDAVQSGKYSTIVVDTAPFGHTLRLFSLPEQFARLLNFLELAAGRDRVLAQHFGGRSPEGESRFVAEWQQKIDELRKAFSGAKFYLVTTAETFALNESDRCIAELERWDAKFSLNGIVLNRAVRPGTCASCKRRSTAAAKARTRLRKRYPSVELFVGNDAGSPIAGAKALRNFGEHVFSGKRLTATAPPRLRKKTRLVMRAAAWPKLPAALSFVVGKGGVGKTTLSAALGFGMRQNAAREVEICSVDPAPSLDDIFQIPIGDRPKPVLGDAKFRASELDSISLFRHWVSQIKAEIDSATASNYSGVHVDLSFERDLFSELLEIVPPGLDEVLAIVRIMELAGGYLGDAAARSIIIDMAPTGHALELLRMPERILIWARLLLKSLAAHRKLALAREAAVKIAELELHARELSKALKSSDKVSVFTVMLPEPLPDRETERLLAELKSLGISAKTIFVNRTIFPEDAGECRRCRLALDWQTSVFAALKQRFPGTRIYAVRDFNHEIAGKKGLQAITKELWELN